MSPVSAPAAVPAPLADGVGLAHLGGAGSATADWHLALLLVLSGAGSLLVFVLAVAALRRRRSLPYLLITAAIGALVARPLVATGAVLGYVPMDAHHTVEHLLDVVIAAFLIAAIVAVGSIERGVGAGREGSR